MWHIYNIHIYTLTHTKIHTPEIRHNELSCHSAVITICIQNLNK